MFDWIYTIFSYLMKGCLFISGNYYIIALFFFALVIQLLLLPLAIKQQKSQIKMAQVRPMEMAIREKYKGRTDRATNQKMMMEIQEMYSANGYNQFSGCLPLLIQLPIIFILFAIVRSPIKYATDITKDDADFVKNNAAAAVEFYEKEKSLLYKDSFEDGEYDELVKTIESHQQALGGKEKKDGDNVVKSEAGLTVYEFSEYNDSGYGEMNLSMLIKYGGKDIETLIKENKEAPELKEEYTALGYEKYAERIPEFEVFGINLLETPSFKSILIIIPILVFATSFLSTRLMRRFSAGATQTDANGNPVGGGLFMEVGMPLISAIFAFQFSAAVGVYWIWRTLIGIAQSAIFAKVMPIPQVTAEQIEDAKRELRGKQKGKKRITIEVDADDSSYDSMIVEDGGNSSGSGNPAKRTPRRIEMLTADEEPEAPKSGEKGDTAGENGQDEADNGKTE